MNIKEMIPTECFTGLDTDGWLVYPNWFICPKCNYGVYFNQQSLDNGFSSHQERLLKLDSAFAPLFNEHIQTFLSNKFERFILDFYCPKCQLPYVIGFESAEFHMADWRFRPIIIFNTK